MRCPRFSVRSKFLRPVVVCLLAATVPASRGETLAALLDSGALAKTTNPVAATFFVDQASDQLPPEVAARASDQLKASLRHQTSTLSLIAQGMSTMGSGKATQQVTDEQARGANKTNMTLGLLAQATGFTDVGQHDVTQRQSQEMREETIQGFADPWIRGIEAARAMERLGDAQSAGRFYMNCIQIVSAEWMNDAALNGILAMGPRRALALLSWMTDNAEQISFMSATGLAGRQPGRAEPERGTVALRGAALRGLGELIGEGHLDAGDRGAALARLRRYGAGDDNAAYFADAATGLGRTRDPAVVGDLKRLAGWRKNPQVLQAAEAALAIGFHDASAAQQLRRALGSKNSEETLRVLPSLLESGDAESLAWAIRMVTARRASEDITPDLRPQIVRELASMPGGRGRAPLEQIAVQGAGNDWLQAWVSVALLELGDSPQLAAVRAAVVKTDWTLDRPGLKYYWSRIRPVVSLVAGAALGAPVSPQQIAQVVGNMAAQELARARGNADDRELASVQMRWQAAAALGRVDDPAAATTLLQLLDDRELSVRMSAATALAVSPNAEAVDGIVHGMTVDFGGENGVSRGPEIRAALLRSAVLRFPQDARTRRLCLGAADDADPGVRFIAAVALAGRQPAAGLSLSTQ
ncbi:MAG TPA: HEAT repeat domain-containing protein [Opitutaceae bacterium]|nr:HEAT repeat domain-containing protein [Opitutaceae bacterium]